MDLGEKAAYGASVDGVLAVPATECGASRVIET